MGFYAKRIDTSLFFGLIVIFMVVVSVPFLLQPDGTGYKASIENQQIASINSRIPRASSCPLQEHPQSWSTLVSTNPKSQLAARLQELGATAGAFGMVELDRDVVELATQVALSQTPVGKGTGRDVRQQADERLFVSNTRAFLLMPRVRPFGTEEPILLGERQSPGRLVRVYGVPLDTIHIVIFEDSVCRGESSFAIQFPSSPSKERIFRFGRGSNILDVIATSYGKFVPVPSKIAGSEHSATKMEQELGQAAAVEGLAHDLIRLIQSL